ncbi:MAG: VCBS repeat-containing protein [Planctomycetes bacterium]|nr:VCBS repeat-containing protein [Planctomycetota bacterium]
MTPEQGSATRARRIVLGLALLASGPLRPLRAQTVLLRELHGMLPPEPNMTSAVALGDVDGDGDLDIVVGNSDSDRLLLNEGFGFFTEGVGQIPAVVGFSSTSALSLGDVDGDGDLDCLVGARFLATPNRLYRNDSSGVFTDASAQLPSLNDDTWAVALGDLDGDGDLDAVVGNFGQSRILVNDSTGVFSDVPGLLPVGSFGPREIALGDLDTDGDLDLFSASYGQDRLFLNDGSAGFTDATPQVPPDNVYTTAVALGDVDGDGDLDAFLGRPGTSFSGDQNRLYLNDGAAGFTDATAQLPAVLGITLDVALGDVDGDGDLDALAANYGQSRLQLNGGSGVFVEATAQLPMLDESTSALALGDLDGDGDVDLILGNDQLYDGARNRLYLNDGAGAFADVTSPLPPILDDTRAIALGDLDGDGDLDAFVGNGGLSPQDRLLLNDGAGNLDDATGQLPQALDDTRAVALGDVDGDGDLDALVGNAGTTPGLQPERLLLNDGSGTFTVAPIQLPNVQDFTSAVVLGDLDGDGDLDVLIGSGYGSDRYCLNGGTGVFSDASAQLPFNPGPTTALALGDLDGDGDLDVMIGGAQERLYLNNGSGVLLDAPAQLPAILDDTRALAFGDVDADGDLDVLIGNFGQPDRLWLNDGAGLFSDTTGALPANLDYTRSVALGDVDGDGDLDSLIGNSGGSYYGEPNRLYLNGGAGVFVDGTALVPAVQGRTHAVVLGDMDGDGDLDLLAGKERQPDLLLSNLTHQLAWRGTPRVGKPLTLDLWGSAWGTWFLAFSLNAGSFPIPPFGILRLDPIGINLVASGILDGQGRASVTYSVPSNPSLVAATVHWQALVTVPARFTNREVTTLADL